MNSMIFRRQLNHIDNNTNFCTDRTNKRKKKQISNDTHDAQFTILKKRFENASALLKVVKSNECNKTAAFSRHIINISYDVETVYYMTKNLQHFRVYNIFDAKKIGQSVCTLQNVDRRARKKNFNMLLSKTCQIPCSSNSV